MLFRNDKKDPDATTGGTRVPLLPLRDIIVFPHMVVPLFVGREKSVRALENVMEHERKILLGCSGSAVKDGLPCKRGFLKDREPPVC